MFHRNCSHVQLERYDDGAYIRAQLTLACGSSDRRRAWKMYAYFALAVYPFGVTSMMFFVVFVYRENV